MKPKWHWSNQENAAEILEKIKSGLKGRPPNKGSFQKGSVGIRKGTKKTKEQIEKWKQSRINGGGWTAWNKGKKTGKGGPKGIIRDEKWRMNLSSSARGRTAWNKGLGIDRGVRALINSSKEYSNWRMSVFKRDGFKCVWCGETKKIEADHIKAFAIICKENNITSLEQALECKELWDLDNGRTLCKPCHKTTDTHAGRTRVKNIS